MTLILEREALNYLGDNAKELPARAIIKDAPILVLDEATSALDSEVEAVIQSLLRL